MALDVKSLTGEEIRTVLPALARLRMVVFRDWPYLYDGTLEYEETYLAKLAAAPGAVCIVARDGDEIVGASTAAPMIEHADEFAEPFEKAGFDLNKIFYCGESVLLKSHRGHGLGHAFFDGREAHAKRLGGFTHSTFCRVVRPDDHPLKPADYVPLDGFWRKRGYAPVDGLVASYAWKDIDQDVETEHADAVLDEAAHRHHIRAHEPPPDPQGRCRAVPDRPARHARRLAGQDRALGRGRARRPAPSCWCSPSTRPSSRRPRSARRSTATSTQRCRRSPISRATASACTRSSPPSTACTSSSAAGRRAKATAATSTPRSSSRPRAASACRKS